MGTVGQSITLANSIIGVGILAMPFCFQQCGVVLATLILLIMGLISRLCCHFLLKSALLARRRNFEFLAFHVFGPAGKLAVEVGIIGFLMGTCIAYFVVVGDLGPQIIAKMFNINQSDILRTSIMVIVSLVCVLPLGLLRNVDSLSNVSAATIGFYFCLVMKVIAEAGTRVAGEGGEWGARVAMWRGAGVLQCVPIFSMALFCQTQLFEIFESLPTLSLEKMNIVTKNAINICTGVYFTLGLFGYIAFCSKDISGNILMSLSPTMASDVIKLGFVMSLAFSFPLIIFPCRASLYSFLYKKIHSTHHDHIINHSIPETTFRCITVAIIAVALFISLLIPNIELVLGLVGSTIGVLICVVFPAACFIKLTFKDTNERVLAKAILVLGLIILVLGTYANLQAAETKLDRYDDKITQERIDKIVEDFFQRNQHEINEVKTPDDEKPKILPREGVDSKGKDDSEVQPPNPVPPNSHSNEVKQAVDEKKIEPPAPPKKLTPVENIVNKVAETHPKNLQPRLIEPKINEKEIIIEKPEEKQKESEIQDAKNKEKNEVKNQEKIDLVKQQQLIETIKQHGEEQKELIKEQKEILDELKKTKKELEQNKKEIESVEAKKIAVESIQKIANLAIKSLAGVSEPPQKKVQKVEPLVEIAEEAVQEIAKKAVEAIEEIKETKIEGEKKANSSNIISEPNNPVQNSQVNIPQVKPAETINSMPPNPPSADIQKQENVNPANVVVPQIPNQNVNKVPDNPVIVPQVSNQNPNAQIDNNAPNQPILQPNLNQNQQVNNELNNQNINQENIKQSQNNQQNVQSENLNNAQNNKKSVAPPQENIPIAQNLRNIDAQQLANEKVAETQPAQNQNGEQKVHSHSPDEPQSYKLEDIQTAEMAKNVAESIPIPIVMNGKSKSQERKGEDVHINNEIIDNDQKKNVKNINNNVENNANNLLNNAGPLRQKRQVIDCTETNSLAPQDREIFKYIVNFESKDKLQNLNNNVDPNSVDILSTKVDLNEGLNRLPGEKLQNLNNYVDPNSVDILSSKVDLNEGLNRLPGELIHLGRSLKSFNEEKRR